jgi:hypothetical protein
MPQHFEYRPASRARRFAIVRHTGLAARQQGPADVRGGGILFAQASQFDHRRIAVRDRDRVSDETALADFEF